LKERHAHRLERANRPSRHDLPDETLRRFRMTKKSSLANLFAPPKGGDIVINGQPFKYVAAEEVPRLAF
jgi:hypothetical protein